MGKELRQIINNRTAETLMGTEYMEGQGAAGGRGSSFKMTFNALTSWLIPRTQLEGTFLVSGTTWEGFAPSSEPSVTFSYRTFSRMVAIHTPLGSLTGTSNSTLFRTVPGALPVAIRPAVDRRVVCPFLQDANRPILTTALVRNSGSIEFTALDTAIPPFVGLSDWTSSGVKGFYAPFSIIYPL